MRFKRYMICITVIIQCLLLNVKSQKTDFPGDTLLPDSKESLERLVNFNESDFKYTIQDYFARPDSSSFLISPDGKFLSYMEKSKDNKNHVYVKDINTGIVNRAIEEKDDIIRGYGWGGNRLFFIQDKGGDENFHVYSTNIDGTSLIDLTPFDGIVAKPIGLIENTNFIIVLMNKNNSQIFEPYKINLITGESIQLFRNDSITNPITDYIFDKKGELRGYSSLKNGLITETYYKDLVSNKFNLIQSTDWKDTFSIIKLNENSKYENDAYVATNLDSDKTRLVLYDLKNKIILKELYSNMVYDVSELKVAGKRRNYELDCIIYNGLKKEIIPISNFYKELYAILKTELGDMQFSVESSDENESKLLILASSDKVYGKYYEYDTLSKKIKFLFNLIPQLKEEDMAEMRPIQFKSRDGIIVHGYITLPKIALDGKKVPLIVNPHGGPQGERNVWGFNPESQLFASRGYATLHVNFRISGGYGKTFEALGYKEIGRKVMDDLEDGVKYVIEQGWIDKDNLAIYGASHGGYASLMGMIKTPDLYKCAVDYVGISNIFTFFNSFPEYWKPLKEIAKEVWYDIDNSVESNIAKDVSPLFHVDKIKRPIFVIQGANDPRVNINESDQIVKALRDKKIEVPYMVKYDEGHGFQKDSNKLELYKYMLGFFAKNFKDHK
ncbi:S9 family peptidase [Elizabethkingia anophelis]|nr:S9 family peptidase [Elizabethkingia anophelis]